MSVKIVEVNSNKLKNIFIDLSYSLNSHDPNWAPPLRYSVKDILSPKHPFYEHSKIKLWLVSKKNKFVGRIAAIVNDTHNNTHNEKCGFFGFFESIEDYEVSNRLLETASSYLLGQGMDVIRGPISPSTNYECGLLIEGHDGPPHVMMDYSPLYYKKLFEEYGFSKAKDLLAYQIDVRYKTPEIFKKIIKRTEDNNRITYRCANLKNWDREIEIIMDLFNDAWEKNWGYVPLSEKEFRHLAHEMKSIIDPNLVIFATIHDRPIGMIVALPNVNQCLQRVRNGKLFPFGLIKILLDQKKIDQLRVVFLGVRKSYQHLALAPSLIAKAKEYVLEKTKYTSAEMSWILEDNISMNNVLKRMDAKAYRTYRIFQKKLETHCLS